MAQGRVMQDWQYVTSVVSMIHNVNCAKKRDLAEPWQFDPFCQAPAVAEPIDWARVRADCEAKYGRK